MSRENYGMMNQEIQDDEVTIDLMELFSALWAKKTIIILSDEYISGTDADDESDCAERVYRPLF